MMVAVDVRCLQDSQWTGVAEYTWNMLRELAGRPGYPEFCFYANASFNVRLPEELGHWGRLVVTRYPNKLQNIGCRLGWWPNLDRLVARRCGKLDIFWLPNLHFFKLSAEVHKVLTVHDLSFIHWPHFFSSKKRWWYLASMKQLLRDRVGEFTAVVAVSAHTKQDLLELYPQLAGRVYVIPPGVDHTFSLTTTEYDRRELIRCFRLPSQYLLTVGTVEPRKNHLLLLAAYEQLLHTHPRFPYDLVVAGTRGWRWRPTVAYWRQLRCRARVHFLGYVPRSLRPALYAGAALFLYPSFYEGFGFPPLEAMASGVPCLVSSNSSLPEVVGEAAVLLDPWVVEEWSQSIVDVLADGALRERLVAAGRERAQQFSWSRAAHQTLKLWESLCA